MPLKLGTLTERSEGTTESKSAIRSKMSEGTRISKAIKGTRRSDGAKESEGVKQGKKFHSRPFRIDGRVGEVYSEETGD